MDIQSFKNAIILIAILVAAALLAHTFVRADAHAPMVSQEHINVIASGIPVRIKIPSIDVDAAIQQVGTTTQGNIGVPTNFKDAAWYAKGVTPGRPGQAIIDGHYDDNFGMPAVFGRLSKVHVGEDIFIDTKEGVTLHFKVTGVEMLDTDHIPARRLFPPTPSPDAPSTVVLITCGGRWIALSKTYDKRVFVTAVLQK